MASFIVQKDTYDASRPFAVLRTFRSFNRVAGRYATKGQAKRRVRDLEARSNKATGTWRQYIEEGG